MRCRRTPKVIRSVRDWAPSVYLVGFKLLSNVRPRRADPPRRGRLPHQPRRPDRRQRPPDAAPGPAHAPPGPPRRGTGDARARRRPGRPAGRPDHGLGQDRALGLVIGNFRGQAAALAFRARRRPGAGPPRIESGKDFRRKSDTPRSSPPGFAEFPYANGVTQPSPGSRSAPWERTTTLPRVPTPTALHTRAQGRAAHPGNAVEPLRGTGALGCGTQGAPSATLGCVL